MRLEKKERCVFNKEKQTNKHIRHVSLKNLLRMFQKTEFFDFFISKNKSFLIGFLGLCVWTESRHMIPPGILPGGILFICMTFT